MSVSGDPSPVHIPPLLKVYFQEVNTKRSLIAVNQGDNLWDIVHSKEDQSTRVAKTYMFDWWLQSERKHILTIVGVTIHPKGRVKKGKRRPLKMMMMLK